MAVHALQPRCTGQRARHRFASYNFVDPSICQAPGKRTFPLTKYAHLRAEAVLFFQAWCEPVRTGASTQCGGPNSRVWPTFSHKRPGTISITGMSIPHIQVDPVESVTYFQQTQTHGALSPSRSPRPSLSSALSCASFLSSASAPDRDLAHPAARRTGRLPFHKQHVVHSSRDQNYYDYINARLREEHYAKSPKQVVDLDWTAIAETFLFGDRLSHVFTSDQLLGYVCNGHLEEGQLHFEPRVDLYISPATNWLEVALRDFTNFNEVLELYASSNKNYESGKLFDAFRTYVGVTGFNIPLAHAMFGNWLLLFNSDLTVESNYDNELILQYFRKAARLALAVRRLVETNAIDYSHYEGNSHLTLKTYFNKHNTFALSIALHNLGEFYHVHQDVDVAVNLWEVNTHLTSDLESGNLAILGLTDGFGYGNKYKTLNKLGKKSKTNKFNTKRRIAHLYRVIIQGGANEVGMLWVWKEKYD